VILADMAGLRETVDAIELEGVRRARSWAEAADLRLWVVDGAARGEGWREGLELVRLGDVCFVNKTDLASTTARALAIKAADERGLSIQVGNSSSVGAAGLLVQLTQRVRQDLSGSDFPATTRARHRIQLEAARVHLLGALASLAAPELAAEDVRLCARALGRVTGVIGVEDVLDQVFSQFCIGK
jgi:tRNA modification GTPase